SKPPARAARRLPPQKPPPQRFSADPSPTALVGDRWTPAADTIVLPFHDRPTHRTSTSDDHPAILAAVRSDTRRMRIGRDNGHPKGMAILLRGGQLTRLARTSQ